MRTVILVLLMVCCFSVAKAEEYIYYDDGGIYNINSEIDGLVYISDSVSGEPTTVNLVAGGSILGRWVVVNDNSQFNILDGSGGYVEGDVHLNNSALFNMYNGSVFGDVDLRGSSHFNMHDGSIGSYLIAYYNSSATVSGGSIDSGIYTNSSLPYEAVVTFYGTDFAIDGTPIGYGIFDTGGKYEVTGQLTGTLANGDPLDIEFDIWNDSSIVLTPEPATLLLLGFGAVMLRRKC